MGNSGSSTTNNMLDALSEIPGTKPRNKTGSKVVTAKLKNAEKTGILSLREHDLKRVPTAVTLITSLRTLDLSHNKLVDLRAELWTDFRRLTTLKLDNNALVSLPNLSHLTALTDLSMTKNKLRDAASIPAGYLPQNLVNLDLSGNLLREFPSALVEGLEALETLKLADNALVSVPNLGALPKLTFIILDGNALTVVGPEVAGARLLHTLSLKRNRIGADMAATGVQCISKEIFTDTAVTVLNLHENPLSKEAFLELEGVKAFMDRRVKAKDKLLAGGTLIEHSLCGLD